MTLEMGFQRCCKNEEEWMIPDVAGWTISVVDVISCNVVGG